MYSPFDVLNNGSDVFLAQSVSSWGQCWNESMWNPFVLWYQNTTIDLSKIEMLDEIKKWINAWSVNFYVYMILLDKYFIFPHISLTTNFSEAGVHGVKGTTDYQVKLLVGRKKYELFPSYNLVKYDVYLNNIDLYKHLDISKDNLCIDLYGNNHNYYSKQYWLTTLYKPYKVIKSYGLYLRPHELNIINNIEGNDIFLYDTYITSNTIRKQGTNIAFLDYHIKEYSNKILIYISFIRYKRLIFTKLKYLTRKILFRKERLFKGIIEKITNIFITYSSDITDAIFTFLGGINARKMHGIIIMFHNIVIENIERNDAEKCPLNKFISILDKLKEKNIEVVSINELLNKRKNKKFAVITFDDALLNTYTLAYPILKRRNIPFTTYITTSFINKHGHISLDQLKALGEEELCTIGSHTITHPLLKGNKNAYNEINNSKTELENILKKEIIHFAYTYGKIHAFSIKNIYQTKKAGYFTAATSLKGEISILTALFLRFLPRVECNDALFFLSKF